MRGFEAWKSVINSIIRLFFLFSFHSSSAFDSSETPILFRIDNEKIKKTFLFFLIFFFHTYLFLFVLFFFFLLCSFPVFFIKLTRITDSFGQRKLFKRVRCNIETALMIEIERKEKLKKKNNKTPVRKSIMCLHLVTFYSLIFSRPFVTFYNFSFIFFLFHFLSTSSLYRNHRKLLHFSPGNLCQWTHLSMRPCSNKV